MSASQSLPFFPLPVTSSLYFTFNRNHPGSHLRGFRSLSLSLSLCLSPSYLLFAFLKSRTADLMLPFTYTENPERSWAVLFPFMQKGDGKGRKTYKKEGSITVTESSLILLAMRGNMCDNSRRQYECIVGKASSEEAASLPR